MNEQSKTIQRKVMKPGTRTLNMQWAIKTISEELQQKESVTIFIPYGVNVNQPVQMLIDVQDALNMLIEKKIVDSYTVQDAIDSYGKLVLIRKS